MHDVACELDAQKQLGQMSLSWNTRTWKWVLGFAMRTACKQNIWLSKEELITIQVLLKFEIERIYMEDQAYTYSHAHCW